MKDGTGPEHRRLADSVRAQRDLRERRGKVTWADELRAAVFDAMVENDPARLREALDRASEVLDAWRRDLEAR